MACCNQGVPKFQSAVFVCAESPPIFPRMPSHCTHSQPQLYEQMKRSASSIVKYYYNLARDVCSVVELVAYVYASPKELYSSETRLNILFVDVLSSMIARVSEGGSSCPQSKKDS